MPRPRETPTAEQIRRLKYLERKCLHDPLLIEVLGPSLSAAVARTMSEAAQTIEYLTSPPEI